MPAGRPSIFSIMAPECRAAARMRHGRRTRRTSKDPRVWGVRLGSGARRGADSGPVTPDAVVPELDRFVHAAQGRMTGGMSPVSAGLAALDWAVHLADSPAHRTRLGVSAA